MVVYQTQRHQSIKGGWRAFAVRSSNSQKPRPRGNAYGDLDKLNETENKKHDKVLGHFFAYSLALQNSRIDQACENNAA